MYHIEKNGGGKENQGKDTTANQRQTRGTVLWHKEQKEMMYTTIYHIYNLYMYVKNITIYRRNIKNKQK